MERLVEFCSQWRIVPGRFQNIAVPLTPRGIGDFCYDVFQLLPRWVVAVINGNRIIWYPK
ncbi:MAG: hypothetical protein CM15mP74_15250 [Halieaceae bacterium]|nr:MAG: hypothetical protein CM15mP74_15250 [Halieaceae bacterium]